MVKILLQIINNVAKVRHGLIYLKKSITFTHTQNKNIFFLQIIKQNQKQCN